MTSRLASAALTAMGKPSRASLPSQPPATPSAVPNGGSHSPAAGQLEAQPAGSTLLQHSDTDGESDDGMATIIVREPAPWFTGRSAHQNRLMQRLGLAGTRDNFEGNSSLVTDSPADESEESQEPMHMEAGLHSDAAGFATGDSADQPASLDAADGDDESVPEQGLSQQSGAARPALRSIVPSC